MSARDVLTVEGFRAAFRALRGPVLTLEGVTVASLGPSSGSFEPPLQGPWSWGGPGFVWGYHMAAWLRGDAPGWLSSSILRT